MNLNNKKNLFILGIIGVIAVFGLLMALTNRSPKVQPAEIVAKIVEEVHTNYANKANYWGLDSESFASNDILTKFRYKGNQLINTLGKPILIGRGESGDVVMPGEKSFDVVFTDLTTKECVGAATYRFEQPENLGLLRITIDHGEKSQVFEWGAEDHKLPISRVEAKRFCSNKSRVMWTFE